MIYGLSDGSNPTSMPGKQARVLCPVCQEPIPLDETECENCGAFVIDEAVVRLSRALGLEREKALQLFEAGFRHPTQLKNRDPNRVLEKGEVGLLFICTNCGGFVASGDSKCPRCAAEFETEPETEGLEPEDILDIVLCPVCGADNEPDLAECEICGAPLGVGKPAPTPMVATETATVAKPKPVEKALEKVDDFLREVPVALQEPPLRHPVRLISAPKPAEQKPIRMTPVAKPAPPVVRTPPQVREAPRPVQPIEEKPRATPQPKPQPMNVPTRPAPNPIRPPDFETAKIPLAPSLPSRRVRAAPAAATLPKKANPTEGVFRISPEIVAGVVLAGGAGIVLAGLLGESLVGAGIAVVLFALGGNVITELFRTRARGLSRLDATLLGSGAVISLGVTLLPSDSAITAIALAIVAAACLTWAAKRLLTAAHRVLLAIAAAVPVAGTGIAAALHPTNVGAIPWIVGIVVATPWPAALAVAEIRRRKSTSILRREVVLAQKNMARQNYERSLEEYDRAIAVVRSDVPGGEIPWYGKGATLILLGRYEEAVHAIDMALDINPHNEVAWLNKGNAMTKLGRLIDALRCFNAAIKVNPTFEVAWNNKGNALARLGKYEEALACYERALGIDSGYRGAWVNKGFVLTKLGRFDEAASCADQALRLDPGRRAEPA